MSDNNFELIGNIDTIENTNKSIKSNNSEYLNTINNMSSLLDTLSTIFTGSISDSYISSYKNYLESMKKLHKFNEEITGTIDKVTTEYKENEVQYVSQNL